VKRLHNSGKIQVEKRDLLKTELSSMNTALVIRTKNVFSAYFIEKSPELNYRNAAALITNICFRFSTFRHNNSPTFLQRHDFIGSN
jgi:hypothetical protein